MLKVQQPQRIESVASAEATSQAGEAEAAYLDRIGGQVDMCTLSRKVQDGACVLLGENPQMSMPHEKRGHAHTHPNAPMRAMAASLTSESDAGARDGSPDPRKSNSANQQSPLVLESMASRQSIPTSSAHESNGTDKVTKHEGEEESKPPKSLSEDEEKSKPTPMKAPPKLLPEDEEKSKVSLTQEQMAEILNCQPTLNMITIGHVAHGKSSMYVL